MGVNAILWHLTLERGLRVRVNMDEGKFSEEE